MLIENKFNSTSHAPLTQFWVLILTETLLNTEKAMEKSERGEKFYNVP